MINNIKRNFGFYVLNEIDSFLLKDLLSKNNYGVLRKELVNIVMKEN